MRKLSLADVATYSKGVVDSSFAQLLVHSISTDSRNIKEGDLFIALKGDSFDGHDFIQEAFSDGAVAVMVEEGSDVNVTSGSPVILVGDTLNGLQEFAKNYRESLELTGVGITGSNGKTSTKDFIYSVLSERFSVSATAGNYNNHIGLPLTILEADNQHDYGVWEMGMSNPGEIALLANIAKPNIGVITNVGIAHIENMGSLDSIATEKGSLAESITGDGVVVLNAEDSYSKSIAERTQARTVTVGFGDADIIADNIAIESTSVSFEIEAKGQREEAILPVPGKHMVLNALMAVAIGVNEGLTLDVIAQGLSEVKLSGGRLQKREFRGAVIIDDTYNANPDSTLAAMQCLAEMSCNGRRFAVIGGMAELGRISESEHQKIGAEAVNLGIDFVLSVGETAAQLHEAASKGSTGHSQFFNTHIECAEFLNNEVCPGDLILIKGSRSSAMENVINNLESS
ncbi:MAG: UDP-N-acetylmuramoyl-tripeptide--D-alanyl-D-alanine ligase [Verrucomicrobiota bacterium]|nr:UDP-N-acetylmuramoyl-tripeptide--D-alanyl-D-alanine ligase [Verrucomicrobiota bacterium]